MANIHKLSQERVRKSPCKLTEQRIWGAQLHLFHSHILIEGWGFSGRFRREIGWPMLKQIDWFMVNAPEPNLVLILHQGDPIPIRVKAPGLWKFAIDDIRPTDKSFDDAPLPTTSPSASRKTGTYKGL